MKQYVNKRQGMLMKLYAIFEYYVGFYETNSFSVKFFMSVFFYCSPTDFIWPSGFKPSQVVQGTVLHLR